MKRQQSKQHTLEGQIAAHKKKLEAKAAALKRGPKPKAIEEKFRQLEVASYIIELLQPGKRVP